jgi:hypothetical protein
MKNLKGKEEATEKKERTNEKGKRGTQWYSGGKYLFP